MSYIGNSPGVASQRVSQNFSATAGQTVFTPSSGYSLGYLDVYKNGSKLINGVDYTASNGVSFTLTVAALLNDDIEVIAYFPRGLSDGYLKAEADGRFSLVTDPAATANGVVYRNGSKVLTTGGALQFDGTNLGLNIAPSAWASGWKTVQMGSWGAWVGGRDSFSQLWTGANNHYNGTNWVYKATDYATQYYQADGTHIWRTAASGTAGNTISWNQAMTLDASGNLAIKATTANAQLTLKSPSASGSQNMFSIQAAGSTDRLLKMEVNQTNDVYSFGTDIGVGNLSLVTAATERIRIDSNGQVGIGVVPDTLNYPFATGTLQFAGGISLYPWSGNGLYIQTNAYYNSGWKYKTTGPASQVTIGNNGVVSIGKAGSGTAGSAITFSESQVLTNDRGTESSFNQYVAMTGGTAYKIGQLPQGVGMYAISMHMDSGVNGGGDNIYWESAWGAVVGAIGSNLYNATGMQPIATTAMYHHRTVNEPTFYIDSDNSSGNYGNQAIYVIFPQWTNVQGMTFCYKKLM